MATKAEQRVIDAATRLATWKWGVFADGCADPRDLDHNDEACHLCNELREALVGLDPASMEEWESPLP